VAAVMFDVGPHKGLAHGYDRLSAEELLREVIPIMEALRTSCRTCDGRAPGWRRDGR